MESIKRFDEIIATGLLRTGRNLSVEEFKSSFTPTRENLLTLWEGVARLAYEDAMVVFECEMTFNLECSEQTYNGGKKYFTYKYNALSEKTAFSTDAHPILFAKSVRNTLIQQSLAYFHVLSRSYFQDALKELNVNAFLHDLDINHTTTKSYRGFRKGLSRSFEGSQASRSTWEHIKTFDKELISLSLKTRIFPMLAAYEWMVANKDKVRNVVDKYGDHGIILLFEDILSHLHGRTPDQKTIKFYQRILDSAALTKLKEVSINRITLIFDSLKHFFDVPAGMHDLSRFLDHISEHGVPNDDDVKRYRDLGDDLYLASIEKRGLLGEISRNKSVKQNLYDIAPFVDSPDAYLIEYSKYFRLSELVERYLNEDLIRVTRSGVYKSKLTSWINKFTVEINVLHDLTGVRFDIKPSVTKAKAKSKVSEDQSLDNYIYHAETQSRINPVVALWKSGQLELGELDSRQVAFKDTLSRTLKKAQAILIFKALTRGGDLDFKQTAPNVIVDNIMNHLGSLKINKLTENMALLRFVKHLLLDRTISLDSTSFDTINVLVERLLSRPSFFNETINVAGRNISPFSVLLRIVERLRPKEQNDKQRLIKTVIEKTKDVRPDRMNELVYVLFLRECYTQLDKKSCVEACFEEYNQFGESIAPILLARALQMRRTAYGGMSYLDSLDHLKVFMMKNNAFKTSELINDVLNRSEADNVVISAKPGKMQI